MRIISTFVLVLFVVSLLLSFTATLFMTRPSYEVKIAIFNPIATIGQYILPFETEYDALLEAVDTIKTAPTQSIIVAIGGVLVHLLKVIVTPIVSLVSTTGDLLLVTFRGFGHSGTGLYPYYHTLHFAKNWEDVNGKPHLFKYVANPDHIPIESAPLIPTHPD